ncbi:hypothetical protein LAZ67_8003420 [Cordylochernes scorpioides]|uniref:Uncharacterized protein n=1 Tax=Cordylochernes scorpioides TaxID=51811 RepID=A0ABY6KRI1_9ARAC|nr:hypothetical protein LAZ67_8003420 [Cordylochernes scorpioides]
MLSAKNTTTSVPQIAIVVIFTNAVETPVEENRNIERNKLLRNLGQIKRFANKILVVKIYRIRTHE